jgi:agmatine deiminase
MKTDYALVARAIAEFEPVLMVARPGFGRQAEAYCGPGVDVVELPFGDSWVRDSGPILVRRDLADPRGRRLPLQQVGRVAARRRGRDADRSEPGGVAERRAPRGPAGARGRLDRHRRRGHADRDRADRAADGHADNVAVFVGPGRVLSQTVPDRDDPNYARLAANRALLAAAADARGRRLEVIELDLLPYREWAGRRIALPYLNFFVGNGCVIVPLACLPSDGEGLARLRKVFPDREVVGVPATNLARRGGGAHCITQQQPLARPAVERARAR